MSSFIRMAACSILGVILCAVATERVSALGFEEFGPAGEHIGRSSDWAKGVEDMLRHPSRVYQRDVNGYVQAYYKGGIDTINDLLDLFAKVDLPRHEVIIRPGTASAESFHGKQTAYEVEFDLPSGLLLHHAREHARSGLYSTTPRLILQIDDGLADKLGGLIVPAKVSMRTTAFRPEDALAHVDSDDRSLRFRAINFLGEAGNSTPDVAEALQRASENEDESIRNAAKRAIEKIEKANEPEARTLRERVDAFVKNHPQATAVPGAVELLETLQKIDAEYGEGFTATGTISRPGTTGPAQFAAWTVTMGNGRLVVEERAIEDGDETLSNGRFASTIYIGPDFMVMLHRGRIWVDGELIETQPVASFESPGTTYDLLVGRLLWPLGRGVSRQLECITEVVLRADGMLLVKGDGRGQTHWEMCIDPASDYLIRSAKWFHGDEKASARSAENIGTIRESNRSVPHTARWTEGEAAYPVSISVSSVSDKMDDELIRRVEEELEERRAW